MKVPILTPVLVSLTLLLTAPAGAQDYRIDLTRSVDWSNWTLDIGVVLNLASAGLKMPAGRSQAEEVADMEFPRLAQPHLFALPVDSSTTVESTMRSGILSIGAIASVAIGAKRSAAWLSPDLKELTTGYRIRILDLVSQLVRHQNAAEAPRTLEPRPSRPYSGILIYASEELPLHGTRTVTRAEPCFFPKVWDSEMNLIYEKNMVEPGIARSRGIVRYGSSMEEESYEELIGTDPLRILARSFFGIRPTDPIIDRDDALKIISSPENRALLKEGRVVIVIQEKALELLQ